MNWMLHHQAAVWVILAIVLFFRSRRVRIMVFFIIASPFIALAWPTKKKPKKR